MKTLTRFIKSKHFLFVALGLLFVQHQSSASLTSIRIGLVLDKGGKDDRSFNASAFEGAMKAKNELKSATIKYIEATNDNDFEPLLTSLAQKNFDIIIANGISQVDSLKKVAIKYPNSKFAIVDGVVNLPNVRSLVFEEHQGSFLVGAIAALTSKTDKIGFIGGMAIPITRRFETGYIAGAKKVKPDIKVEVNYLGITPEAWNNPGKEKEVAVTQYNSGVDVIFSASGASITGLFDAAEEMKKLAIGVDANQNWIKPGFILTSMVKHVDQAVYNTCKDTAEGKFTGGIKTFGLGDQGVGYSVDSFNDKILLPAVRSKVEELKAQIISGKIQVPDFYKIKK